MSCDLYTTPQRMGTIKGILIEEQTYERNREAVDRLGATVVLKKHGTEIFFKDEDFKLDNR